MNFNDFYSSTNFYFSQDYSQGMGDCISKYNVSPCTAVDIGAGEGRNSIYLSSIGFSVIAIEPSIVGAEKINKRAHESGLSIDVRTEDFLKCSQSLADIGFIVALTSLEHMESEYLLDTVAEM